MNRLFGGFNPDKVPQQPPPNQSTEKQKVKAVSPSSSSSSASLITPNSSDTAPPPAPVEKKKWSLFRTKKKEEPQQAPTPTPVQKFPQEEFDAIAKAIIILHGETAGPPIASAAMTYMEEIQKALHEDVPNIRKANAALLKLKETLLLPGEDGEKAILATKTRIEQVAQEPLAHAGVFVDELAEAITEFDREKFIVTLQRLRMQPPETQKALIPIAKGMIKQVRELWTAELQKMRQENELIKSQVIQLMSIAKNLENVPDKEEELSTINEKLADLNRRVAEYPTLVEAIDNEMFTLTIFNIALTLPRGPFRMPDDPTLK